jgi:hypothetical protein
VKFNGALISRARPVQLAGATIDSTKAFLFGPIGRRPTGQPRVKAGNDEGLK